MDVNDWPTRLKGCRTSATGTLRDVLNHFAGGRTQICVSPAHREVSTSMVPELASSPPIAAPAADPLRRRGFSFDCE